MEITEMLLTPNKYSRPKTALKNVKKIAVHYVGNAGSTAKANRNYFESLKNGSGVYASSHYIIGLEGEVIRCVPESEVAYCTNEANSYSISIENCHPHTDGKFNEKTRASLIELCAMLCGRYGLDPLSDIIRHYDVTGKKCPLYWVEHPDDFMRFKHEVAEFMMGGKDMEELKILKERVDALEKELAASEEKVFESVEDVPEWGRSTVKKLVDRGWLRGDGEWLDMSYTLLRLLVINDRAGLYDFGG